MRLLTTTITRTCLLGVCLIGFAGCDEKKATTTVKVDDHDGHDHDGHDHDGHDHEGHDHQIDAKAAGLNADDLVSLDGPGMPDNLNDAIQQLSEMATTIGDGFKNDKVDDVHGSLHNVGNLLEAIKELAKTSDLDDDAKKSVAEAVEQLSDGYGAVDLKLHNAEKGKDYADVADSIDAAAKTLLSHVQ